MWSTRIFLIGLLLVKADARPGGYGVKGGRVSKATATAVASAHADAGSFGTAKSSASAIASASSNGDGASEAIAHANASTDGGNIVRGEPREKENGHANELGDSDDLRESNDRGKGTEYKSINHQDGTGGWNSRNPDAEHVASGADDADSIKREQTHDEPDCGPKGIKGHRGTSSGSAGSGCKNKKPGGNSQFPAHNGDIDLSADWQHSTGENGGENSKPGAIDRGHAASPCTPGDPECLLPVPAIFNPRPSYNAHPVLPDDSLRPPGIQSSYGQHGEKPESFSGSPCACANGDSKCQTPNHPHPHGKQPDVPLSSLTPPEIANSYPSAVGIDGSHSVNSCAPGDSKCSVESPSVMSPYPKPQRHPDSSLGSHKPTESTSGYGENSEKPGMVDRSYAGSPCGFDGSNCFMGTPTGSNAEDSDSLCGPGDSKCIEGKPSASKPHSTIGKQADSTGGYGEDKARPGHSNIHGTPIAGSCGSDSKCASHRPTSPGHHSGDSQHSIEIGSQFGANSQSPGTISPAHSGHPASGKHPGTSNPFLNGEIDVSSVKSSSNSGAASGGMINPLNPFLNPHHQQPHHPTGSSNHPSNSNGNTASPIAPNQQNPQAGASAENDYAQVKPNPSNPFLHPHGHVNPTSGVNHPGTTTGSQTVPPNKFPSVQAQPGINGSPNSDCHGSASCAPHKPSELFPTSQEHPHGESPPGSGNHETKPNSPNPFFSQHQGHKDKPEDSTYPETNGQDKPHAQTGVNLPPNDCLGIASCAMTPPPGIPPKNPFFTNHGHKVETAAGHKPTQYPNAYGSSTLKPDPQPSGLNPFLGHGKDHSSDGESQANGSETAISSADCNHHKGPTDKDFGSSVTEGLEIDRRQNNYGVKGRRPGVKGGSRGPPMKLQGSSGPGEIRDMGSGQSAVAQSSAVASANAFSHASASSSAAGAQSSASAKSEAYSMHNSPDGLSGSWASSRAEASAFASSYSSSSSSSAHGQGGATVPETPAQ